MSKINTPIAQSAATRPAELRGLKNLGANTVSICEPWSFHTKIPPSIAGDKEKFGEWKLSPSSEHLFFTATEALNPGVRPSKQNPVRMIHGLIADYDIKIRDGMTESLPERYAAELEPTWRTQTFSGGARLIWMFEHPIAMDVPVLAQKFMRVAKNELRLEKLLPALDEAAWKDLSKFYDVGCEWQRVSRNTIPVDLLNSWLWQATQKIDAGKLSDVTIPLEVVEEEVHRRFPGRWDGQFEVGRRGCVFFDLDATNPTSAIVTEAGMICFSTDKLFYSWRDIFGAPFVRAFESDKIGRITANTYFDGRFYYSKGIRGFWDSALKEDYSMTLRTTHGLDPSRRKGDTASEIDRALVHVQKVARVDALAPKIYHPEDVFHENGKRYLNISRVRAMPPAETEQEWGVNFPWLGEFFNSCWDKPVSRQKEQFLDWFKRYYCSALAGNPAKGHALFLAGPIASGKTLTTGVLGKAFGGMVPADSFLLNETTFNKEMLETGLWVVDDATSAHDPKAHLRFSENVKKFVANSLFNYNAKYKDETAVTWNGRLVVALNDDEIGIRMVPALEQSIEDKLVVLRFGQARLTFPSREKLEGIIDVELPFLLRWLVDWEPPAYLLNGGRFGLNYIHPKLRIMALNSGGLSDLFGIIEMWVNGTGATCGQPTVSIVRRRPLSY